VSIYGMNDDAPLTVEKSPAADMWRLATGEGVPVALVAMNAEIPEARALAILERWAAAEIWREAVMAHQQYRAHLADCDKCSALAPTMEEDFCYLGWAYSLRAEARLADALAIPPAPAPAPAFWTDPALELPTDTTTVLAWVKFDDGSPEGPMEWAHLAHYRSDYQEWRVHGYDYSENQDMTVLAWRAIPAYTPTKGQEQNSEDVE